MKLSSLFKSLTPVASEQKSDRVVGIDIGSSSIKVVELQDRKGVITLTTYGEVQLGPYAAREIGEVFSVSPDIERQAVVDVLRESAVKATQGVFAIPLSVSFATVISLLANADEDLDSRIRVEARKYIPIPLSEVTLDWAEIEKTTDVTKRNILLAAIQNKPLERFNSLLTSVKLYGTPTEIECFSTIRGADVAGKETVAVIDFGATTTKLYIVRKGLLQRMYRIPTGMVGVTTEIATQLNQTFGEAEVLKKTLTTSDEKFSTVQKIYANHFRRALVEFSHVLTEYTELTGSPVETIVLSGSGVLLPEFPKLVEETIGLPVTVANPFNLVAYPAFMEDPLKDIGPIFSTALGAALRTFV